MAMARLYRLSINSQVLNSKFLYIRLEQKIYITVQYPVCLTTHLGLELETLKRIFYLLYIMTIRANSTVQ